MGTGNGMRSPGLDGRRPRRRSLLRHRGTRADRARARSCGQGRAPRSGGGAQRSALTAASTRAPSRVRRCRRFLPTDSAEDPDGKTYPAERNRPDNRPEEGIEPATETPEEEGQAEDAATPKSPSTRRNENDKPSRGARERSNRIVAIVASDAQNLTAQDELIDFRVLDREKSPEWIADLERPAEPRTADPAPAEGNDDGSDRCSVANKRLSSIACTGYTTCIGQGGPPDAGCCTGDAYRHTSTRTTRTGRSCGQNPPSRFSKRLVVLARRSCHHSA